MSARGYTIGRALTSFCARCGVARSHDEIDTLHQAGRDAGIAPDAIDAWLGDEEVAAALREDMGATRAPLPEALALAHRLSRSDGGLRYSTASAVFEHGQRRVVMPGFQPFAVYGEVFLSQSHRSGNELRLIGGGSGGWLWLSVIDGRRCAPSGRVEARVDGQLGSVGHGRRARRTG
jgi:hypothetical protein